MVIRDSGLDGEQALEAAAEWAGLSVREVRTAVGYYAEFPDEIDDRIRQNIEEAAEAEKRWRREQNALRRER